MDLAKTPSRAGEMHFFDLDHNFSPRGSPKKPDPSAHTTDLHQMLFTYRKNPIVWPHCLGKNEISSSDDDWDKSLVAPCAPFGEELNENTECLNETGVEDESSSDAIGGVTSSSSDDEGGQLSGARRRVTLPKLPECLKLKQHRKLKTLHLMEKQNTKILVCGRTADPDRYEDVAESRFDTPCCVQCWKKRNQYAEGCVLICLHNMYMQGCLDARGKRIS